jgi:uncharacterized tellurite resistance protein B-like protein
MRKRYNMKENMKEEFLKAIEEGRAYDFVAQNYYKMSDEELKDIALEALYAVIESNDLESVADELRDRWEC